jgi:fucose 4-O-acetylase-like acetyltransferase
MPAALTSDVRAMNSDREEARARDASVPVHSHRIEWVDCARGIGIILVVVGHVIDGLLASRMSGAAEPELKTAEEFIYAFHMPVFFVLAGLFAPRSLRKGPKEYWSDKLGGLLCPYIVWSILQLIVLVSLQGVTNTRWGWEDGLGIIYQPIMQFWFLYCLLLAFLAYRVVCHLGGGAATFFVMILAMSTILDNLDVSGTSVLGRARDNLPFFALGILLSREVWRVGATSSIILLGVSAAGFCAIYLLACRWQFRAMLPLGLVLSLPGIAAVFALSALLVRWEIAVPFSALGRFSLEIYLAHVLAYAGARILLARVLGVTSLPVQLAAGIIAGLACPLFLVVLARVAHFPYLFRWPMKSASGNRE